MRAGLSAAGKTDGPYLWLHMWEREIEDTQVSALLTCTPGALVLTLKMCHESRKKMQRNNWPKLSHNLLFILLFFKKLKLVVTVVLTVQTPEIKMPNDLQSDKPFKLLDQPVSRPTLGTPTSTACYHHCQSF